MEEKDGIVLPPHQVGLHELIFYLLYSYTLEKFLNQISFNYFKLFLLLFIHFFYDLKKKYGVLGVLYCRKILTHTFFYNVDFWEFLLWTEDNYNVVVQLQIISLLKLNFLIIDSILAKYFFGLKNACFVSTLNSKKITIQYQETNKYKIVIIVQKYIFIYYL